MRGGEIITTVAFTIRMSERDRAIELSPGARASCCCSCQDTLQRTVKEGEGKKERTVKKKKA